ncbi:carbamoyltransferase C-terminal domain-containing protein, partial [Mycobacteroides abscessus subsp. massiliense]
SNVWVQPAAGDAGTALGAALALTAEAGIPITPMRSAQLGAQWSDQQIAVALDQAAVTYERPDDLGATVAESLAANKLVGWFQGPSEFGPRALG